ncbi:MAG TPA: MATE family efflux transporter, partial [Saprospiraceae bacterium]|nr:MATE family efflux transporter [Saprospiraceae bacterium]
IFLSDNVFLYNYDQLDFAAVGLVGAFYLIIASIGFGFSRGGQILMARKYGEKSLNLIGKYFQSLIFFELAMASVIFVLIQYFAEPLFKALLESDEILSRCLVYLKYRSYGIFFSFVGVSLIALYTGVARNIFILFDTVLLAVSNIVLNYIFIFGKFGIEPMGIKGAAIASTLAEALAFVAFAIYIYYDKENRPYKLFNFSKLSWASIKTNFEISFPILAQSVLSIGSYFLFFTWIENRSQEELKISNLIRNVYLILSIPSWGYSTGINTIVSYFIGKSKRQAVGPMTIKTSLLNIFTTVLFAAPILIFPTFFLSPLYGGEAGIVLIEKAKPLMLLLIPILALYSIGSIYHNSIIGTGHTKTALWLQAIVTILYLIYCFIVIKVLNLSLMVAWSGEFIYWGVLLLLSILYLNSNKWFL